MLNCLYDVSVPEDSKCSKCCLYCDEKDSCEYRCIGLEEWKTEEEIINNCIECEDETEISIEEREDIYMNKVYLIWLSNDDIEPMVVGIATNKEKANAMRDKLASTDGFEFNDYEIVETKSDTVIIDNIEYKF